MTVKKLSVALDADVAAQAAAQAEQEGVSLSAWLNAAAEHALAIRRGLEAVREFERENGAFTDDELAAADEILDRHGIGR